MCKLHLQIFFLYSIDIPLHFCLQLRLPETILNLESMMLKYEIEIVVKTIQPWSKKKALKTQGYSNLVNEIKVADVIDLRNYKYLHWESPI